MQNIFKFINFFIFLYVTLRALNLYKYYIKPKINISKSLFNIKNNSMITFYNTFRKISNSTRPI